MAIRTKTLYATKNGAYVYKTIMPGGKPSGLLWHSTGADNPWIQRYAGDSTTTDTLIGANPNNNGFQQTTDQNARNSKGEAVPCPNAVMGLGTDGEMLTVKVLPDDYCSWCSGSGNITTSQKNGFTSNSANFLGFYQLEVCEDKTCTGTVYGRKNPHSSEKYAQLCYNEIVEYSIDFFKTYFNGDPEKVTEKTLTSHAEANKMGIASSHSDPWHWLGKYGYSGDTLRKAVKDGLTAEPPQITYTAVKGDSMSKIARSFGVTLKELIAANPQVTNPNILKIGQVLNIPAGGMAPPAEADPVPASAKKSADEVAQEIWRGQGGWGNDPQRREKLIAYGGEEFRNAVQKRLNELAAAR